MAALSGGAGVRMAAPTLPTAWMTTAEEADAVVLRPRGRWDVGGIAALDSDLRGMRPVAGKAIRIDLGAVEALDTAGAWVLYRTERTWRGAGHETEISGARPEHSLLLDQIRANDKPCEIEPARDALWVKVLADVGEGVADGFRETGQLLGLVGAVLTTFLRGLRRPRHLRLTSLVHHIEKAGLNAIPIVGLIAFLIGVVLAYQGSTQLARFGAEIFSVNLVAVAVLREMGILLTAVVVAGRSGSAFTAHIGSMKANEEVDALRALGLDPVEILVLPRVLALAIAMPLLAFFADIMGLLGGGVMAWAALGISPGAFIERLNAAVGLWAFWVGIIKAPVFGILIALVACNEGLRVVGGAEGVGRRTTRSVVISIFLVIVVDAFFSIFFAYIGV